MILNKLIALDLGSSHISAMAGEVLDNGALRILSEESKPSEDVKWGIVEKPSGASFKISELIRLLRNSAKLPEISQVSVPLNAKSMKSVSISVSRFVNKPNIITDELLAEMLEESEKKTQQPKSKIFDTLPVSYFLDGKRMDEPIGKKAHQITANYQLIIGSTIIESELERCFDRTGIMMEFNPLAIEALSTVLLEEMDREKGCALINLGATTSTLAIYFEGIIQQFLVVPLGAQNITRDIQELGIAETHAERLKRLKGSAMEKLVNEPIYIQIPSVDDPVNPVKISTKFLATIIEARLEEMLQPIFDIISGLDFSLDGGIVLCGGGSKLNGIVDFIIEKTNIYTRIGNHSEWLSEDTPDKFNDILYAPLIGTILLTHEFRKEHQGEPEKKPKIPKKKPWERIADGFINFFGDDNKMNEEHEKKEKTI